MTSATITEAKMASPPALGSGSLLSRRALGSSAQPTCRENTRTRGMNRHAARAAMMKVRITVTQPNRPGAAMPSAFRKSTMGSSTIDVPPRPRAQPATRFRCKELVHRADIPVAPLRAKRYSLAAACAVKFALEPKRPAGPRPEWISLGMKNSRSGQDRRPVALEPHQGLAGVCIVRGHPLLLRRLPSTATKAASRPSDADDPRPTTGATPRSSSPASARCPAASRCCATISRTSSGPSSGRAVCPWSCCVSNWWLMTEERYLALNKAGVSLFSISLDFPDERHDDFREIPGLFAKMSEIIPYLVKKYGRENIVLNSALTHENFDRDPGTGGQGRGVGHPDLLQRLQRPAHGRQEPVHHHARGSGPAAPAHRLAQGAQAHGLDAS